MAQVTINPKTGAISVEGCDLTLERGRPISAVQTALTMFYRTHIDHRNGYEWLAFHQLSFFGEPCALSVGFKDGALTEVHLGVALPNAPTKSGWPTREAIEQEICFVRSALSKELSRSFSSGRENFSWGEVWSLFDPKGFMASAGVRYA